MDLFAPPNIEMHTAAEPWSFIERADTRRYEVRPGDQWSGDQTAERSEVMSSILWDHDRTIGVSYDFMVEPGVANTADWMVIGQFHSTPDEGEQNWSPPFAIYLVGEQLSIAVRSSTQLITLANPREDTVWRDAEPIVRGHWYSMDIRLVFSKDGKGSLAIWRDGVPIFAADRSMGYNDVEGLYWKEGIYRAPSSEAISVQYRDLDISYLD